MGCRQHSKLLCTSRPGRFIPEKGPMNRGLRGPQSRSELSEDRKSLASTDFVFAIKGFEPRIFHAVAYATPAPY